MSAEAQVAGLSPRAVAALAVVYTAIYVVPIYLSPTSRPAPNLSRDSPTVIRSRVRAASFSCLVCTLATLLVVTGRGGATLAEALRLMGWWPVHLADVARVVLLVAVLFAGPLFEAGVVEGGWTSWIRADGLADALGSWTGYRNYVAGPVTEELIWRSLLVPPALLALPHSALTTSTSTTTSPSTPSHATNNPTSTLTPTSLVLVLPLSFALAHIHHFYEFSLTHPRTPLFAQLLRSLFQVLYTSLFGAFATFAFLRCASLPAVVAAHAFCNWMGLPRLWGRVGAGSVVAVDGAGPDHAKGLRGWSEVRTDAGVAWSVAYYALLVGGAVGFYVLLWPLTESERALVRF
ncbi:hypothetical protein BDY21DRAFT_399902 [Lineolata rhizophorae]|uniref:intramembrane prenyl-peptidase Rce1 n=1 Tax=Lineolata rhizophorae TaxID=578093 RepID=A0A6A6NSH8_9PEZI|nr:hypothetical protein BDY21DRAFT_399902 [Lineolata rhizophorae]